MLALVLSAALTATATDPTAAVLVGRRTSVAAADAQHLAQDLSKALVALDVALKHDAEAAQAGLARLGLKESASCSGRRPCLAELGRQLGVTHVIAVSVSEVGSDRAIALELLLVADASVVDRDALVVPPSTKLTVDLVRTFGTRLATVLKAPPRDAPVVTAPPPPPKLTPDPAPATKPEPTPEQLTARPAKSHTAGIVLIGAGAAMAALTVGMAVASASTRADALRTETSNGVVRSPYSASEVQQKAGAANAEAGVAIAAGIAAAGLGVVAVVTW